MSIDRLLGIWLLSLLALMSVLVAAETGAVWPQFVCIAATAGLLTVAELIWPDDTQKGEFKDGTPKV